MILDDVVQYVTGQTLADMDLSERAAVESVIGAATALVDRYAAAAGVPDPIRREAISRLAFFDYHTRFPVKVAPESLPIPSRRQSVNPLRSSGAMALLSPWKVRHTGTVSGEQVAARDRRIEGLEARLAALETAPDGVSEAQLQSAIAAAVGALPVGVTLPDVQGIVTAAVASLAGRAVELVQVFSWTAPNSQSGHNLRSTGMDLPAGPLLVVGRLGSYVGASFLPAAEVSAIPRNDTARSYDCRNACATAGQQSRAVSRQEPYRPPQGRRDA